MVTAELVVQSAKALLMSAGGGLAARKGLEALGLKTADPLLIADSPAKLADAEERLYLLEEPHEPLAVGLLPEPDQLVEPPSRFAVALTKTLAEPFVLPADRLAPAALVAWACGAAAALLLVRLVSVLRARSQGPNFSVRISETTEGPAAVDVRSEAFDDDGWRRGSWVDLGAYRWRRNALAKGFFRLAASDGDERTVRLQPAVSGRGQPPAPSTRACTRRSPVSRGAAAPVERGREACAHLELLWLEPLGIAVRTRT